MNFTSKKDSYNPMLSFLKNHPFAVEAHFDSSIVLTFAVAKEQLQNLIPECLELDIFEDKYAFIAVAMVQTKDLRPKGFPKILGNDFFLIGYRVFVRYSNNLGRSLRGLYILKSETDKKKMEIMGNIFTHYNYTTTDIKIFNLENSLDISSKKSDFKVCFDNSVKDVQLPVNSPFSDWKQARRYAGPLPFTFTFNKQNSEVLIIEGVRQNWNPEPIEVSSYYFGFLNKMNLNGCILANAFLIKNIPYYWKKGRIEQLK